MYCISLYCYSIVLYCSIMSCDFVCGWFAGCCGLVVGHPFDTLKVRQQALKQTGILDTLREATRNGWSTVWRGMAFPLLAAGSINSALFGVYGLSLSKLTKDGEKPGYLEIFLAGCIGEQDN